MTVHAPPPATATVTTTAAAPSTAATAECAAPGGRRRVAVIGGGRNCEHEVSLATAASVRTTLDPARYEPVALTIGTDGLWYLLDGDLEGDLDADPDADPEAGTQAGGSDGAGPGRALGTTPAASLAAALTVLDGCDLAFPAVHGPLGEDGTLAGLLELAGVPYVGAGVRGGALAMDKWATKLVATECGLSVAPGRLVTAATAGRLRFRGPVVVKPVAAGSSHGVALVEHAADLAPAVAAALALDDRVLVEEVVRGREVDIAVLEREDGSLFVSPSLEIAVPDGSLFDTRLKYGGTAEFHIPADLDDAVRRRLAESARTLFASLGCSGVARFDFFVTDGLADGGLVLNEVNTMPGMTAQSQVPKMFAAAGLPYAELLDQLVRTSLARR
ncbi:D-alanine--D-alanine ligase [Streptomyces sp. SM14]|uniref:D-alanine--D-alanine ligase family protein n=1 Tax=Streptomyces sp. SM14 TaxID=1736045 RepID=UPI000CD53746|nr:D-alanine--D-alanine ligase [Streptomyces sp. SM14]